MKSRILFCLLVFVSIRVAGQEESEPLTLEKIYKEHFLQDKRPPEIQWMPDGSGYTTLVNNSETGGDDIILNTFMNHGTKVLVSAGELKPAGADKPLSINGYTWSPKNDKLLIFTNTRRVWRYHTRGDYWVFDLATRRLQPLGKDLERSSLMFAKFSPQGDRVAYVSSRNIFVEDLVDGKITRLTSDGGENIINGTFDWVYEEELDCRDGFRWSPDGQHIAYWQMNTQGVGTFYIIDNVDSIYPTLNSIPYPKAGTTNPSAKIGFVSSSGGETHWLEIPGDPRNNYLARMEFIPGIGQLMIQQLNRRQNTDKVWIADLKTMEISNILTETDDAFLDIHDDIYWVNHEQFFTWISERDGWLHAYLVSRDGKTQKLLTPGNYDVMEVCGINEKSGFIYFTASPDQYTQKYLYRCSLTKPAAPELITPPGEGMHSYEFSPDARWAIHTFSNHVTPNQYSLVTIPKHEAMKVLEDNHTVKEEFDNLHLRTKEFFKVDIGNVDLDAWMIKPPDFDSTKKYPVIFYVYGEPAGSTVQDSWSGGSLWDEYLSQLGYIVMSVDNRGTHVYRGREWRKCIYEKMGVLTSADQAAAVKEIEKTFSFVDPMRIGVWGWSGGGSSTLNAMFRYPDLYSVGIAVAFVSNLRLYDTIYQERYTGIPGQDDKAYDQGSPINFAGNLKGKLLLIHGTGDDNVHYQNCEMLVNELIKDGKMFSMLSYPMRTHGIYERPNTTYHLRKSMENFWLENLTAGGK